jgi:hypothetical protein
VKYAEEGALVANRRDSRVPKAPRTAEHRVREAGDRRSGTEARLDVGHGGTGSTSSRQGLGGEGTGRLVPVSEPWARSRLN